MALYKGDMDLNAQGLSGVVGSMSDARDVDVSRRFGGVGRLYGADAAARFAAANVCVVGIGGVGSWVAEALARSAVGAITLIDLDMVAESNTNRQIHALDDVWGLAKVDAMRDRILAINPVCKVRTNRGFRDGSVRGSPCWRGMIWWWMPSIRCA